MKENIVLMHFEDAMATFEKPDGSTFNYPRNLVPSKYSEGDIIKAIIRNDESIEFISRDIPAIISKRIKMRNKLRRLKRRTRKR